MSGGVKTRSKKKPDNKEGPNPNTMNQDDEDREDLANANPLTEVMRSGLDAISKEIHNLKAEMKKDLTTLKEQVTKAVKSEINELKQEIYQQLSANTKTLQIHGTQIAEAEDRIMEMETWNIEV